MTQHQVMRGVDGRLAIERPGRVDAGCVSQVGVHPWLVEGRPAGDPVPQTPDYQLREIGKGIRRGAVDPSPRAQQSRWEVPMIERRERLDALCEQGVYQ